MKSTPNSAYRLSKLECEKMKICKQIKRNIELDNWGEHSRINDVACDRETPGKDFTLKVEFFEKLWARKNVTKLSISDAFVIIDGDIREDVMAMIKAVTELTEKWFYIRKKEQGWVDPHSLRSKLKAIETKIELAKKTLNS